MKKLKSWNDDYISYDMDHDKFVYTSLECYDFDNLGKS